RRPPLEPRPDDLVHVLDGLEHALAAEPLLIAIPQLDCFVLAGRGAARHRGSTGRSTREGHIGFDRRVAPAIEDLARAYRDDRAHDGRTLVDDALGVNAGLERDNRRVDAIPQLLSLVDRHAARRDRITDHDPDG